MAIPRRVSQAASVALIAGVAAGYWWWSHRVPKDGPLELQGNVEVRQVNLSFKVSGRIKTVRVDEGEDVSQGDTLAELDKIYFDEALAQMKAQRDQAKANLDKMISGNRAEEIAQAEALAAEREATVKNTKTTLERAEQLLKSSTGTQKAYDDALAAHRQGEAQLRSARQALQLMKAGFRKEDIEAAHAQFATAEAAFAVAARQLVDASLLAPSNGTILSRVRENGAIVNAGETVYVLTLTSPIWVRSYVSETDLGRIQPGHEVTIKSDTPGMAAFRGRIGFISTTAEFTPKTVETRELRTALVYRIRIVAEDPHRKLRQGMPVTITVDAQRNGSDDKPVRLSSGAL